MASPNRLERTIFEISRASEYFNVRELLAQTGQPAENFVTVALKELVDNALDACETEATSPEITIVTKEAENTVSITVSDNGPGIRPETVEKILNFDTRTSDKTVYRSPTRGAQGNALKTVLGMPRALGYDGPVTITSCGIKHTIRIWTDPAGYLRIDHKQQTIGETEGTRVSVAFPIGEGESWGAQEYDFDHWSRAFALYNPHALVGIEHAQSDGSKISNSYQPTVAFPGEWRKYLPTDLTSPWWYTPNDLERLVFSHIGDVRRGGHDLTLREFVRQFKGLSGTAKAKEVCDQFNGIRRLSDLEQARGSIPPLLTLLQQQVKPPSPRTLGAVGENHFRRCFEEWFSVEHLAYKKVERELKGVPWVFEIALAEDDSAKFKDEERTMLFFGVNFSPTYEDPFSSTSFACHEYNVSGLKSFLSSAYATGRPVAAHMVFPF